MFDISFMELLIILMIALIVIGPERLPTVARTIGHLYGRCRNFMYSIRTDIHNEMRMEELKKMQSSVQDTVESLETSVQESVEQLKTAITNDPQTTEKSPEDLVIPPSQLESGQLKPSDNRTSQHADIQKEK
ncbi:Sec-independent protein translocase protein TatB [Nitrosomonas ureae]|uniref:Sec-independent protein translocase protein TatB n=1 Tax=Nitrosomonas ureae TaxID=44577 RepID=A0A1H2FME8_9PROT|nr:Sec-independent protein translocase protein TatB [Nitrosomonas ureae]ALQ51053.1 preprotein translocase subunit TatA [Nitrosomonas ureae]SDU08158.1 sec-independent protein translocase protein TatB [Nitrosomonas ureae]